MWLGTLHSLIYRITIYFQVDTFFILGLVASGIGSNENEMATPEFARSAISLQGSRPSLGRIRRHDKLRRQAYNLWQESSRRNLPPCSLPNRREGRYLVIGMSGRAW